MIDVYGLSFLDLQQLLATWDLPPVHARQLWRYLYCEGASSPPALAGLPHALLRRWHREVGLASLVQDRVTTSDGGRTRKYLLRLHDGARIETVLMRSDDRVTACLSTQVGCGLGCVFCATGQQGLSRNLTAGEIVAQAMFIDRVLRSEALPVPGRRGAQRDRKSRLANIVLTVMCLAARARPRWSCRMSRACITAL